MAGYSARSSVKITKFDRRTEQLKAAVAEGGKQGALLTGRAGIRLGERLIELRGTKGSKARFAGEYLPVAGPGNSDGRNDTGTMSGALLAEVSGIDDYNVSVEVGWLGADYQKYFGYQELGFENRKAWDWRKGKFKTRARGQAIQTEGMFIFRDIETLISKILSGQVSQAVSREMKKVK